MPLAETVRPSLDSHDLEWVLFSNERLFVVSEHILV